MPNQKYIINWEITLRCNLDCSFCSQQERRYKQKDEIDISEALKIVSHLPAWSHISFLWWETFLFKQIFEVFQALQEKNISFEITTNGSLIKKFMPYIKDFPLLKKINISIDGYGDMHNLSRGKKYLFEEIIDFLPSLNTQKDISVSTLISDISYKNLYNLYNLLNDIWIPEQKLIYAMSFWEEEIQKSRESIKTLLIAKPGNRSRDEKKYKKEFFEKYILLKKQEKKTKISFEPDGILAWENVYCKQIQEQFRINERGELSICEFIENSFWSLINSSFEELINTPQYKDLQEKITSKFPLEICKTCCKLSKK